MSLSHRTIPLFILTLLPLPKQLQRGCLSSFVVLHIPDCIPYSLGGEREQVVEGAEILESIHQLRADMAHQCTGSTGERTWAGKQLQALFQHPQACFSNPFFTVIIYYLLLGTT